MIRFGGPVFVDNADPEAIAQAHAAKGYRAAFAPAVDLGDVDRIRAVRDAFGKADVMIAEVGYWENLLDTDADARAVHRAAMKDALALADELGAKCAIDILGSYHHGPSGHHHHAENFSSFAFDEAVDLAREIIDGVNPTRASFAFEIFPFNVVDSPETVAELVKAVDRKRFGVHLDLVNLINAPRAYFDTTGMLDRTLRLCGDRIVSAHLKDIKLEEPSGSVILHEVRPGLGNINFHTLLRRVSDLPQIVPMMMEHLPSEAEYDLAAAHIRSCAREANVDLS